MYQPVAKVISALPQAIFSGLIQVDRMMKIFIGSQALSFSDPYFHFACLSVRHSFCHSVIPSVSFCLSATSELNISETRPDSGMVPTESLYKLAYGLSIGRGADDVT